MNARDIVKRTAKQMNGVLVQVFEELQDCFEGVIVAMDQLNPTDVNGDTLIKFDEYDNPVYKTDVDFIIIESGAMNRNSTGDQCYPTEQLTITYVSTDRPDMIEDILTIYQVATEHKYIMSTITKDMQPIPQTSKQVTLVTAIFTRAMRIL